MNPVRRSLVSLLLVGVGIVLVVVSLCAVLYSTALNPAFIKHVASSSGLYENVVDSSVALAATLAEDKSVEFKGKERDVAQLLDDVKPALNLVLNPIQLQTEGDRAVDGFGSWLDGETEEPDFTPITEEIKDKVNFALVTHIQDRLLTLPLAPSGYSTKNYDPLTSKYRLAVAPTPEDLLRRATEFTESIPVVNNALVKGIDLLEDPHSRPWSTIQRTYWWGRVAVGVLGGLLVLVAALSLAFSRDRLLILKRIGRIVLPSALLLLLCGAAVALVGGNIDFQPIGNDKPAWINFNQEMTMPLVHTFFTSLGLVMIAFGAAYTVVAVVSLLLPRWLKKRRAKKAVVVTTPGWVTDTTTPRSR